MADKGKGNRPVKRITAVMKENKQARFDIGGLWPPKNETMASEGVLNLSLDRSVEAIKVTPRGGGQPVKLTNENAFFQLEDPYDPEKFGGGDF